MPKPLVTVVLPVRNAESTIGMAIGAILCQTLPDWELLVIDDGSTDRTLEIACRFQDDRVKIIREPSGPLGLATRLNQCIALARGAYVARMDGDDISYPWRLQRQVAFLENNSTVDLLGAGAVVFEAQGEALGRYPSACTHEEICRRPWWGFPLAHPTWMGKLSWFRSHPYSEQHTRCEDQALLFSSRFDSRFAALPDILLGYRLERISANKLGRGRLNYCRLLVRQAHDPSSVLVALRGILTHAVAYARDLVLQHTGSSVFPVRSSFESLSENELHEWHRVWEHVSRENMS